MQLDTVDRKLLNLVQTDFPICQEPFSALGSRLDISGDEVIRRIEHLKQNGIIRSINGVFDSAKLGYRSTLVAMNIPGNRLDEAADTISQHPGVSHNYARNHHYNLWFTLTVPGDEILSEAIDKLARRAGAEETINLPALRLFKIRVYFDVVGSELPESNFSQDDHSSSLTAATEDEHLSEKEKKGIIELQNDLPLKEKPFDDLADHLHIDTDDFLKQAESFRSRGIMRRYGALLRHQKAGFSANAMSCWSVPADMVEHVGTTMASFQAVSHCYERQTGASWKYNMFAMIHGRTRGECEEIARRISQQTGTTDYILLYSTKEYKKDKVRYFTEVN